MRSEVAAPALARRLRFTRRRALAVLLLVAAAAVTWRPILRGIAGFMHVRTELQPSDYILPLYRDGAAIPPAAVELYRAGLAPRVLLYRVSPGRLETLGLAPQAHEAWRTLLISRGVPPEAIVTLDAVVANETELGRALSGLATTHPVRVIALTSGPTSRLSRNALRAGMNDRAVDLRIHPVPLRYVDQRAWWKSRRAWVIYFDSYCYWLLTFIR